MEDPDKKKKKKGGGFQAMGLDYPVFKAVLSMGYKLPTPIQRQTIGPALEGVDLVAMARTGSGKTAAFLIPTVQKLKEHKTIVGVRAVVMSPTRELALQTAQFARQIGRMTDLRICVLVGGMSMDNQFDHLASNPDIIIATPGRLVHHMKETKLKLTRVEVLVMDEADRLFELGFADELNTIIRDCPPTRQTLLFSATLPSQLVSFTRAGLSDPKFVRLDVETTLSEQLELCFLYARKGDKVAMLVSLLRRLAGPGKKTIVFTATRHHVEYFGQLLPALGITTSTVHGTMDQTARQEQVYKFRGGKAQVMVVTDVAARGIDIPLLDHVVNFDFPSSAKLFVHRAGRTARAGRSGTAFSVCTFDDLPYAVELMLFLGRKLGTGEGAEALGCLPGVEEEFESVERFAKDPEMEKMAKSMAAAYGLYYKTRPAASKQSVRRAKELIESLGGALNLAQRPHPKFGSAGSAEAFVAQMRKFKPKVDDVNRVLPRSVLNKVSAHQAQRALVAAMAESARPEEAGEAEVASVLAVGTTKARVSKRARRKGAVAVGKTATETEDVSVFERTDCRAEEYVNEQLDPQQSAKESGLDMERFRMDLIPDENASMKHAKSVMRWDAKKKRYMVKEVDASGREVKEKREDPKKKKKATPNFYANWQKSSHKRIQEVGEQEDASLNVKHGKKRTWAEADDAGDDAPVPSAPDNRKPIVPFHGTVEAKYLTHKQKRLMDRRKKAETNAVTKGGRAKQEVKPLTKVAKEKREKEERRIMSGGIQARHRLTDRKKAQFKDKVQAKIDKKSGAGYARSFSIANASSRKKKKKQR